MIYNVSNKESSSIKLWKTSPGNLRIIELGKFTPLLIGTDYTLIDKSLTSVFDHLLADEIEIKTVKIIRKATGEEWNNYVELIIHEHINPDKIKIVDFHQNSVWQFQHHLFVSLELKETLEKSSKNNLVFSEGFSHFG